MIQNKTRIYLDHAATSPLLDEARAAMEPYFSEIYGNASSPYAVSQVARSAVDDARSEVAQLIGAHPDELVFTSGGTESDNWALLGVALSRLKEKGHFIVSSVEHHAVLEAASSLRELGFEVDSVPVGADGAVSVQEIARLIKPTTLLVSVMSVNNEVGTVQPVEEIGALCREHKVLFHTDAVQAAGKIAVDVGGWNCDLLSLSSHKIGGPKGAGALYIRRNTVMRSLLRGGGQERGRRAGTENVPAIVGFGVAARIAREGLKTNSQHLSALQQQLENGLAQIESAQINGNSFYRAPHITNVSLKNQRAEMLALNLDLKGFAVGTGSACASGAIEPSHVLRAMGVDEATSRASLRISLGAKNTSEEIAEFLAAIESFLHRRSQR